MKYHNINFNLKGYDKVIAIHKLKQSIDKFGDKSGKKNALLNTIRKKNIMGNSFLDLKINRLEQKELKHSVRIHLLNKNFQNDFKYKNEGYTENDKNNSSQIKKLLNNDKIKIENETLNNSYDEKIKKNNFFSENNKKDDSNNNFSSLNNNSINNKGKDYLCLNLFQGMKKFYTLRKNKTYNHFYYLLNNNDSSASSQFGRIFTDKDKIINIQNSPINYNSNSGTHKSMLYKKILFTNKNIAHKFKYGPKPKIKINCKLVNLGGGSLSTGNINQKKPSIKNRTLFRTKYNSKIKLTKIKISKTQNDLFDKYYESCNMEEKDSLNNCRKNFGQQTINDYYLNLRNRWNLTRSSNLYKRIPTYIRLPNINKVSFPNDKLKSENTDFGFNYDNYSNNYFYLKDSKNQSINKIYMINPFIRNKIINSLIV
jgi:hypothetical protein